MPGGKLRSYGARKAVMRKVKTPKLMQRIGTPLMSKRPLPRTGGGARRR